MTYLKTGLPVGPELSKINTMRREILQAGGSLDGVTADNIEQRHGEATSGATPAPTPAPAPTTPTPAPTPSVGGLDAIIADIVKKEMDKNGAINIEEIIEQINVVAKKAENKLFLETKDLKDFIEYTAKKAAAEIDAKIAAVKLPTIISMKKVGKKITAPKIVHKNFEELVTMVSAGVNLWITGPAGGGKTYAAQQAAEALDVPFHFSGAVSSAFELLGFIDAKGHAVETSFKRAWRDGGLFCLDEIDASDAAAITRLNGFLAGDVGDFPDGEIKKHKDFFCVATANTIGNGASREYVGRQQQDGAALDRFVFFDFQYDEALEAALANNDAWTAIVFKYRQAVKDLNLKMIISPRASIYGAKLLAAGLSETKTIAACILKGAQKDTLKKLKNAVKEMSAE